MHILVWYEQRISMITIIYNADKFNTIDYLLLKYVYNNFKIVRENSSMRLVRQHIIISDKCFRSSMQIAGTCHLVNKYFLDKISFLLFYITFL